MEVFKKSIEVDSSHLDFNNHVNNLVYLQWALDISREHWLSKAGEDITFKYFWVVRKHQIEYLGQAFEGDHLDIQTFVESIRGPFSERIVKIYKEGDLITDVRSNWCLIKRETQKLKRVPEEILTLFN